MKEKQAVLGILFSPHRDQVLVLKRRDVPIWVLPGGGVDPGESPEEAVVREFAEETTLRVVVKRKIAEYSPQSRLSALTHFYECQLIEGTPSTSPESCAVGFFPIQKLPQPFFPLHVDWMQDALKNLPQTIYKPIDQITFKRVFLYFCQHPTHLLRYFLGRLGIPFNTREK